jgi:hypothetical protein
MRSSGFWSCALAVVLAYGSGGCEKDKPAPIAPPQDSARASAPPAVSTPTPPAETASAAPAVTATTTAAAMTSATVVAKGDAGAAKLAAGLKPASKHIVGSNFALDVASPGCKAADECVMTIKLAVAPDWHINKEYPYKFVAAPSAGVTFLGKSDANTFSKAAGDFAEQGEKAALMTVRFKAAAAGEARVTGKYKLSVCSAAQCQIEEQAVDLPVPVI